MKSTFAGFVAGILLTFTLSGFAQNNIPQFWFDIFPKHALPDTLKSWGTLVGENATVDAKTREMISLGVSAQIPCEYCVYAHRERLKKLGVSEDEIKEAVAIAAYIRMFSTILHGSSLDMETYKAQFDKALAGG